MNDEQKDVLTSNLTEQWIPNLDLEGVIYHLRQTNILLHRHVQLIKVPT